MVSISDLVKGVGFTPSSPSLAKTLEKIGTIVEMVEEKQTEVTNKNTSSPTTDNNQLQNILYEAGASIFPPLKMVEIGQTIAEEYPETAKAIPQTIAETILPATPIITQQPPYEALNKGIFADTTSKTEEALTAAGAPESVINEFNETVVYPETPSLFPDLGEILDKIKTPLIIAAAGIAGLWLLGKYIGRGK